MATVGIIGGIGPESTIEYYRLIISSYREHQKDNSYPQIIINSIDMTRMLDLIAADRLREVTRYLVDEVGKLAHAGADFGLLASNTPHIVFDDIQSHSPIPLISIVEETCAAAKKSGYTRLGLFGTAFTMKSDFYENVFSKQQITIIVPDTTDQDYIHEKYMDELVHGILRDQTKAGLLKIMSRLKQEHGIQGLILGGTELPLILTAEDNKDIPFLDTTQIHVGSVINRLIS
jgi:aspartate racemase